MKARNCENILILVIITKPAHKTTSNCKKKDLLHNSQPSQWWCKCTSHFQHFLFNIIDPKNNIQQYTSVEPMPSLCLLNEWNMENPRKIWIRGKYHAPIHWNESKKRKTNTSKIGRHWTSFYIFFYFHFHVFSYNAHIFLDGLFRIAQHIL